MVLITEPITNPYHTSSPLMQPGFFDWQNRFEKRDNGGDPLQKLSSAVNGEIFRAELEALREKQRKSNAGAKPYDAVMMFKILIIQSLYHLSDEAVEYQILDRMSFMRFLGLRGGDGFKRFEGFLAEQGYAAKRGQIIDGSIVSAPRQRNSREENSMIKQGHTPQEWHEAKKRQKDVDARWTKKNGTTYYGYKNQVRSDVEHKFIRGYDVTDAAVHDSQVVEELLDKNNSCPEVYADSAYLSERSLQRLGELGFVEQIQRKGFRGRKLSEQEQQGNRRRARIRSRIEHVFGVQAQMAGSLLMVRCIGIMRARIKIGLRNLADNLNRYAVLATAG